jgi:hypothetical protein
MDRITKALGKSNRNLDQIPLVPILRGVEWAYFCDIGSKNVNIDSQFLKFGGDILIFSWEPL